MTRLPTASNRRRGGLAAGLLLVLLAGSCQSVPPRPDAASEPPTGPAPSAIDGRAPSGEGFNEVPRQVRPGVYAIGLVTLDQTRRTVSFPAVVNQRAGLIEYLVVTTGGKIHESVFRTVTEPRHIHLALLLLGVKPADMNQWAEDPSAPLPGERVMIEVVWRKGGREVRRRIEDFVRVPDQPKPYPAGPWVYSGSFIVDGTFAAQAGGSIVSIQTDPAALVNNPRADRDDGAHVVRTTALPRDGTLVEVVIRAVARNAPSASPHSPKAKVGLHDASPPRRVPPED